MQTNRVLIARADNRQRGERSVRRGREITAVRFNSNTLDERQVEVEVIKPNLSET